MELATITDEDGEAPVIVAEHGRLATVRDVLPTAPACTRALIEEIDGQALVTATRSASTKVFHSPSDVQFVAPYRRPHKIWGIGLNYVEHASDLAELVPEEPASFMKGDHTIIGPGEPIPLPPQSQRVTAEAELGLVIGRYCRDVPEVDALDYVWGVTPILDQTAEDILARNPRFLTRSKNFPGFFSFGPAIVPLAELLPRVESIADVEISTRINGVTRGSNRVGNMRYPPDFLISFHSRVMPLFPGDIISTGTPAAARISPGDVASCHIPQVGELANPVTAEGHELAANRASQY